MSNRQIFKEQEYWHKRLFWFIIRDTLENKDKYYPDPNWSQQFLKLEEEGFFDDEKGEEQ